MGLNRVPEEEVAVAFGSKPLPTPPASGGFKSASRITGAAEIGEEEFETGVLTSLVVVLGTVEDLVERQPGITMANTNTAMCTAITAPRILSNFMAGRDSVVLKNEWRN